MIIPFNDLPVATLNNLIESFILREGTDYGENEFSLDEKIAHIKRQLKQGIVVIVYSQLHESVNIMPANTFSKDEI
ncbi:YheU family protein [Pseudoalteromonas denitrificans]|uniref:Uncharacterized protein n=1 Tax=Pseudoalteromonas denitrificans DSM 6059 TaxID=1123010 RepID=A0A1I1U5Z9_9GAMM|nr:YheU family protein [Pseudoalteromonas denitrificans]SFD64143.1 hypothetical protein SAMN02745724_05065 [Pseudoalteromonas denitrificans DSM 6059]